MERSDKKGAVFPIATVVAWILLFSLPNLVLGAQRIASVFALVERQSGKEEPCLKWDTRSLTGIEVQVKERRNFVLMKMRGVEKTAGCSKSLTYSTRFRRLNSRSNEFLFLVEAPYDALQLTNGPVKERISFEARLEDLGQMQVRRVSNEMIVTGEMRGYRYSLNSGNSFYLPSLALSLRFPSLILNSAQIRVALATSPFRVKQATPSMSEVNAGLILFPWVKGSRNVNSWSILAGFYGQDFRADANSSYAPQLLSRRGFEAGTDLRFAFTEGGSLGMSLSFLSHLVMSNSANLFEWTAGLGFSVFGSGGKMTEILLNYGQNNYSLNGGGRRRDEMFNLGLRILLQPSLFSR